MQFLHPWGWLGLLALPAILALHFFRRRYERRRVATLLFWQSLRGTDTQGRALKPIRSSLSLWLQLLAATLMTLLLAGPQTLRSTGGKEVLVVLDSAYALQARRADGRTVADVIRAELSRRLDARGVQACTVIEQGVAPRLLTPRRASPAEARRALAAWNPAQPRAPWTATQRLVQSWNLEECVVWVFSDTLGADWRTVPGVEFSAPGGPVDNLALLEPARIRRDNAPAEILRVNLHNFGPAPVTTELRLSIAGRLTHRWPVTVPPGGVLPVRAEVELGDQPWHLEAGTDALPFDNVAVLCPVITPPVEVVFDFQEEARASVWRRAVQAAGPFHDAVVSSNAPVTATLVISDRLDWMAREDLAACVLVCARDPAEPRLHRPPFLCEGNHPLLAGVDWNGCLLAVGAWPGTAVERQLPRVSAREAVILSEIPGRTARRFLLHADLARSNLARQPAFPILVHNAMDLARGFQPGLRMPNLRFGERLEFRLPAAAETVRLSQAGWSQEFANPRAVRLPPDRTGLFELRAGDGAAWPFAVNHGEAATSDLRGIKAGQYVTPEAGAGTLKRVLHDEWMMLLTLLALAVMLADWRLGRRPPPAAGVPGGAA